jgi:hypothetical protein
MAFTLPMVPTGMKIGVSIRPWSVEIRPARADPSVFFNSKFKAAIGLQDNVPDFNPASL